MYNQKDSVRDIFNLHPDHRILMVVPTEMYLPEAVAECVGNVKVVKNEGEFYNRKFSKMKFDGIIIVEPESIPWLNGDIIDRLALANVGFISIVSEDPTVIEGYRDLFDIHFYPASVWTMEKTDIGSVLMTDATGFKFNPTPASAGAIAKFVEEHKCSQN